MSEAARACPAHYWWCWCTVRVVSAEAAAQQAAEECRQQHGCGEGEISHCQQHEQQKGESATECEYYYDAVAHLILSAAQH